MDFSLLQEPLGFLRVLELVFSIAAFATCANFRTNTGYHVDCEYNDTNKNETICFNLKVSQHISYPFNLDSIPTNISASDGIHFKKCVTDLKILKHSGDYHFGAKIFIFVGVSTWIVATFYIAIFILCPYSYLGNTKNGPIVDLCTSMMIAILWIISSSLWAHGLIGMKYSQNDEWLFSSSQSP